MKKFKVIVDHERFNRVIEQGGAGAADAAATMLLSMVTEKRIDPTDQALMANFGIGVTEVKE